MEKLKKRWGITSNWDFVAIFIVFGVTGTCASKLAAPVTEFIGLSKETTNPFIFWPIRILLIFPIYQVLLVAFGWLFGQSSFFLPFSKKMLSRVGFKKLIEKYDQKKEV